MSLEERIAVAETKIDHIKESVDRIEAHVETLINERHESIGKKSVWAIIYGAIGAVLVTIFNFLGNKA